MVNRRKYTKRDSLGRRTDRVRPREEAEMRRLYLSGLTPREIAVKLDRKVNTVKHHLTAETTEKDQLQSKTAQVVARELLLEIRNLAQHLEQLTYVQSNPTQC